MSNDSIKMIDSNDESKKFGGDLYEEEEIRGK